MHREATNSTPTERQRSIRIGISAVALIGLAVVLLVIVAASAPGVGGGGDADASSASGASSVLRNVLNVFLAFAWGAGAVILVFVVRTRRRTQDPDEPPYELTRRPWWIPVISMLIIIASVAVTITLIRSNANRNEERLNGASSGAGGVTDARRGEPTVPSGWMVLAVVAGAATAGFVLFRRGRRPIEAEGEIQPDELVRAVDETIEDIDRDTNPRRAIIRAYTRMERALTDSGLPRRPSETPVQYIEGALLRMSVPAAPARSLTELFEVARFSDHPVDASMKWRAIDCLLEIRHALASEVS